MNVHGSDGQQVVELARLPLGSVVVPPPGIRGLRPRQRPVLMLPAKPLQHETLGLHELGLTVQLVKLHNPLRGLLLEPGGVGLGAGREEGLPRGMIARPLAPRAVGPLGPDCRPKNRAQRRGERIPESQFSAFGGHSEAGRGGADPHKRPVGETDRLAPLPSLGHPSWLWHRFDSHLWCLAQSL